MASRKSEKHDLTPSSKASIFQSKKKRFRGAAEVESVKTHEDAYCIIDFSERGIEIRENGDEIATICSVSSPADETSVSILTGSESHTVSSSSSSSTLTDTRKSLDFSGAGIKKRQKDIRSVLLRTFLQCEGNEVEYVAMENVLKQEGLWCPSKSVIPCVKKTFAGCTYVKTSKKFIGIKKKDAQVDVTDDNNVTQTLPGSGNKEIDRSVGDDEPEEFEDKVAQLLRKQHESIENMVKYFDQLEVAQDMGAEPNQMEGIKFLVEQVQEQLEKTTTSLVTLYQNKLVELHMSFADQPLQRSTESSSAHLSIETKDRLVTEIKLMEAEFSFGLKGKLDRDLPDTLFEDLAKFMKQHCHLLSEVFETLIMGGKPESYFSRRVHRDLPFRLKGAVQALSCLVNIGNQETTSDMPVIFGLVAISYGAGEKFVTLLNQFGITKSWATLVQLMEERLNNFGDIIQAFAAPSDPLYEVIDNINIYRGTQVHLRLFKAFGPKMWNFTGRYLCKPFTHFIDKSLMESEVFSAQPQRDIKHLVVDDILIDSGKLPEHQLLWEEQKKRYILQMMKIAYQFVPANFRDLVTKTEKDFKEFVKENGLQDKESLKDKPNIKGFLHISVPPYKKEFPATSNLKSRILIQPISTQDESSITGTAAIIEEFAKEIDKEIPDIKPYLLFDEQKLQFDLSEARQRYIFAVSMQHHKKQHENLMKEIICRDKTIDIEPEEGHNPDSIDDLDEEASERPSTLRHLQTLRKTLADRDEKFKTAYIDLKQHVKHACQSTDAGLVAALKQSMKEKAKQMREMFDQYKRTFLHAAVEDGDHFLVKLLLAIGFNPNIQEGCGATPLVLAVVGEKSEICKTLVGHLADIDGPTFIRIPLPKQLATHLGQNHILDIFEKFSVDKEDEEVWAGIYGQASGARLDTRNDLPNEAKLAELLEDLDCNETPKFKYSRESTPTIMIGDNATTKNIRSARWNNFSSYSWISETPGDFHCSGYLEECFAKAQGPGGLYYAVNKVLKRTKLSKLSYGKNKFNEGNYKHIKEANRDVAYGYGIAAALSFKESSFFPSAAEFALTSNKEDLLVERFHAWVTESSRLDPTFKYRMETVLFFGPLRDWFYNCIRYGNGRSREACYMLLLPMFGQLSKKNYFAETLVHIVNIIGAWPLVTRLILQHNCSVNVSGHENQNIAYDEFMETFVVRPLKSYVSGKTTLKMFKAMSANIQVISSFRNVYRGKGGFDIHYTEKHSTQCPLPDQLKVALFCLKEKFFCVDASRKKAKQYANEMFAVKEGFIPNDRTDIVSKGKEKVKSVFQRRMFELFPERRQLFSQ